MLPGNEVMWPLSRYSEWAAQIDVLSDADRLAIGRHIGQFPVRPHFRVLIAAEGEPAEAGSLEATLRSLSAQLYADVSVTVPGDVSDARECFSTIGEAEWLLLLRPGDRLAEHALYWFAFEALAKPYAAMIYADDDAIDGDGRRCLPRFKPEWSLTYLRSTNYIGRAVALRGSAVRAAGGARLADCLHVHYDLLLRVAEHAGDAVVHIPAVLLHRASPFPDPLPQGGRGFAAEDAQNMAAVRHHIERCGLAADVIPTGPGCRRVRHRLPSPPPRVSIIVPTRDAPRLLWHCVESLMAKTTYPDFEILVVDNRSAEAEALAYLDEIAGRPNVRVLRYDRPFNYSAINNFAVREAHGELVCLLNNDTEVISPDWLEEMVGHLLQNRVGVVGAKLYYPDGRVQHAGDVVGPGGCANHLHSFIARDDPGYCNRAAVAQELSAVTAACLLTKKDLYERLGGLDEKHLPVAFNDVDYCLRVREAGYKVVWTPHAELYHHESVSRGKDRTFRRRLRAWREVRYMRRRWREAMKNDPFYNPNFSYERTDFVLGAVSRVRSPWADAY